MAPTADQLNLRLLRGEPLMTLRELSALLSGEVRPEPQGLPPIFATLNRVAHAGAALRGSLDAHHAALTLSAELSAQLRAAPRLTPQDTGGHLNATQLLGAAELWLLAQGALNLHARLVSGTPAQNLAPLARRWRDTCADPGVTPEWADHFLYESAHALGPDLSDPAAYALIHRAHTAISGAQTPPERPEPTFLNWHRLSLISRRDAQVKLAGLHRSGQPRYAGGQLVKEDRYWPSRVGAASTTMNMLWDEHLRRFPHGPQTDWGEEPLVTAAGSLRLPARLNAPTHGLQTLFILAWCWPHAARVTGTPLSPRELRQQPHLSPAALKKTVTQLLSESLEPSLDDALRQVLEQLNRPSQA